MFSLISLILDIFILVRVYKYDKFYMLTYGMTMKEYMPNKKNKKKDNM